VPTSQSGALRVLLGRYEIASVGEARFDVIDRQTRVGSEQLMDVRILGEVFQDQFHWNASALDNRLAHKHRRIPNDALGVDCLVVCHACPLFCRLHRLCHTN
jgi:hypothetical protein